MLRFITLALLASAAVPVAANAQRGDNDRPRAERGDRGDRGTRGDWSQRGDRGDRGGYRGDRGTRESRQQPPAVAPQQRSGPGAWVGRPGWAGPGTGSATAQPPRDWNRNDGQRRDWNRDRQRRDWRNDGRRWDGNRGSRNWSRDWRNDRRYDWQGYRSRNRYAYRMPRYYAPSGWGYGYRRFDIGSTLFAGLFARNYWISDPYSYRLPPVEWPYQWVRYYDDALLVDTETGRVVDSIPGIFW